MAYLPNYSQNPTQQRLNELFLQLCSNGTGGKDTLILDGNCFQVIGAGNKIKAQLCLDGFGYPTDSSSVVSAEILGGETLQLFDNNTETYFAGLLPSNKAFVRGVILLVQYPSTDDNGVTIDPARMNVKLGITSLDVVEGAANVTPGSALTIAAPATQIILTASASPNSGSIISKYKWSKVTVPVGDVSSVLSPNTASTKVNDLSIGEYVFQIDVTDSNSAVATSTVKVIVYDPLIPAPTIDMMNPAKIAIVPGTDTAASLSASAFANGSASTIDTVQWTQVGGPIDATIIAGNSLLASVTGMNTPGIYTFQLEVTDDLGGKAVSNVTITTYHMQSINLPLHNLFSHFSNPVTLDPTMILNGITITNMSTNMPICIKALLINTKADNPIANATNNSCNC